MAQKEIGRLANAAGHALGNLSVKAHDHPWATLFFVAALSVVAWFGTRSLQLNTDLIGLLPPSFPSVKGLEELKQRFGAIGYVVVLAQGAEPEQLKRFTDDVVPKLEQLPTVRYVEYHRSRDFFETHALYYLELQDLEELHELLEERANAARRKANPLLVDLEDEDPEPIDVAALRAKYAKKAKMSEKQLREDYYLDPERKLMAILIKPAGLSTSLSFAQTVVADVNSVLKTVDLSQYGPNLSYVLGGTFTKKVEEVSLLRGDLSRASGVAVVLLILYLAFHFRRFGATVLVLLPLFIGILWAFGFAGFAFGTLNILTAFIGAILTGLGIDNGIHLLGRYEAERSFGHSSDDALSNTFAETGRGTVVAAVTTLVAFAGLSISEFRAFREFGVIAAVAMALLLFSYCLTLPALLSLAERWGWRPRQVHTEARAPYAKNLPRLAFGVGTIASLVLALGLLGLRHIPFDFNFRNLVASDLPSFKIDLVINEIIGYSQTPAIVLTNTPEEERITAQALRKRMTDLGDKSSVQTVATSAELVPQQQADKKVWVDKMAALVAEVLPEDLKPSEKADFELLKKMTSAQPFARADLPEDVRQRFEGPDGKGDSGFVLVYPGVDLSDGSKVSGFAAEVRGISEMGGRTLSAAGEVMVMADIFDMVVRESPKALLSTLILVFFTSWIFLGRLTSAILALLPAFGTMMGTLGLLHFTGLSINYLNLVMIPVLFGMAVDGGAHFVCRLDGGSKLEYLTDELGHAIAGALITTAFGFGALTLAHHRGLSSMGEFTLFGLAVNYLACVVAMPAFIYLFQKARGRLK